MTQVFYQVFDMSLVASLIILIVLAARLVLKKAPQAISYGLGVVVLFRLLCPWSPESNISVIPPVLPSISQTASLDFDSSSEQSSETTHHVEKQTLLHQTNNIPTEIQQKHEDTSSLSVQELLLRAIPFLWLSGIASLLFFSLISMLRLRRQLIGAVRKTERIYLADHISSPFVLGLIRPKIYLPSDLRDGELLHILTHEQIHIQRRDHIWKALGYLALTVHWFNPLVWVAFSYACKDMETSCDEAVVRKLGSSVQPDYSATLLRLSTEKHIFAGSFLAFGEGNPKDRIKHILNYRKPALWIALSAFIITVLLIVLLAFNPVHTSNCFGTRYFVNSILYQQPGYSFSYATDFTPSYSITEEGVLYSRTSDSDWQYAGTLVETTLNIQELNALFNPSNNQVQEIMDDIQTVYHASWQISGAEQQLYYYLLEYRPLHWRNSVLYLAVGHSSEEMRWLFQLSTVQDGVDLEYLEFAIAEALHDPEITCFAVHEAEPGWLLAGWVTDAEMGIMEFNYNDSQRRRTYDIQFGVQYPMKDDMTEFQSWFIGPRLWQTEYVSVITNNENQSHVGVIRPNVKIHESTYVCPALVVIQVPYGSEARWDQIQNALGLITTTAETTTQFPQENSADQIEERTFSVLTTPLVYNLTEHTAITLSGDRLNDLHLFTNSTKITATISHTDSELVELQLYAADAGDQPILMQTLAEGESVVFSNLTSSRQYYLQTTGQPNTMVTITD